MLLPRSFQQFSPSLIPLSNYKNEHIKPTRERQPFIQTQSMKIVTKVQKSTVWVPWVRRAFQALDSENRGYLYKSEILEHIEKVGVSSHV